VRSPARVAKMGHPVYGGADESGAVPKAGEGIGDQRLRTAPPMAARYAVFKMCGWLARVPIFVLHPHRQQRDSS
jgi:hypothetical protein